MEKKSYGKIVNASWDWTREMLFRPFRLKKWIMLYLILLLSGQITAGVSNFNFNWPDKAELEKVTEEFNRQSKGAGGTSGETGVAEPDLAPTEDTLKSDISDLFPFLKDRRSMLIAALFVLIVLGLLGAYMFLWMWVQSNFSFVFIDSVVRNDASFRVPFHRNKTLGSSYFKWRIAVATIASLIFGLLIYLPTSQLIKAGLLRGELDIVRAFSVIGRYVPAMAVSFLFFLILGFFTGNFVLPVMYKKKTGILRAWGIFLVFFARNVKKIFLYALLKLLLAIVALIAAITAGILGVIALLLIGGLLALLGWLVYTVMPAAAKPIAIIVLLALGIPALMCLMFLYSIIFLPIPVFFRIFSINFLGSIDGSLDLFAPKTSEEIAAEGDDAQYRKSMASVWFVVLLPLLTALLGIVAAISIPNLLKTRAALSPRPYGGITDFRQTLPGKSFLPKAPSAEYAPDAAEAEGSQAGAIELGPIELPREDAPAAADDIPPSTEDIPAPDYAPAAEPEPLMPDALEQKTGLPSGEAVVHLKNGNIFRAEIASEDDNGVTFKIEAGTFTLPRGDILRIER